MNTQNRLIRFPEMRKTGFGKAWLYRLINEERFPQPVKIGIRAVAFVENEIDEWIVVAIEKRKPLRKRKEIQ
ncbi:AlpA family transcriptional regulator [Pectobacterium parmentieri]|uniref:AlpA family transcriptional regulator n=1 Tax=Pectobacterium parmentieri TaxID=1905730 RepID=A0A0H3I1I7_PECPM|nr:AlpA family transcriptional regulator [Pectobacterium parmentieri]AFI89907.1 Phage transcriptional regulator, AlpA [Pectobacterium parmentieri]MBI0469314.1 AlpA family transcriptional regulator [Pectobacterium parmentieri]MBI0491938.1 AlpA family transcriptional regulator [Pectobacterium parmentieri]MBI0553222.1 AlpA family transcriptional regulator [Pectobacterium parmentieri]MBI0566381.1 AlpA family transcriptional regulator [Pectobacterium parmentieri]